MARGKGPKLPELETSYLRGLNHLELAAEADTIADLFASHSGYQVWHDCAPSPPEIKDFTSNYKCLIAAAANKDELKGRERDAARDDLLLKIDLVADYAVMTYMKKKDPLQLQNIRLVLKDQGRKSSGAKSSHTPQVKVTATHGPVTGTLFLKATKPPGNGIFQIQMCDEPNNEEGWRDLENSVYSRIEVKDLEPGKRYYFRVRFHGVNGAGPWSEVVSIIAL